MAGIQGSNQALDFVRALKRRRWQVLVPALLVSSLGISFAVIVPKKYKLTTRIEIASDAPRSEQRQRSTQEIAARREAPAVADHIRHYTRVKEIIERNLPMWPEYVNASEDERIRFIRKITEENLFAAPTSKDSKAGTIFVDISFSDESKERAVKFLEEITTSWLVSVEEADQAALQQERAKLQEIVADRAADLKAKEDKKYDLLKQLDRDPSPSGTNGRREDPGDWHFTALEKARGELTDVLSELTKSKLELEQAQTHYQAEPETLETSEEVAALDLSQKIEEATAKLTALQEEIANLRPANSEYGRLQEKIEQAQHDLDELTTAEPGDVARTKREKNPLKDTYLLAARVKQDQVATLELRRDGLEVKIKDLDRETQAITEGYKRLDGSENEVAEARQAFNSAHDEWLEVDKDLQLLVASPRAWKIAKPPVPSQATVQPNPVLIAVFSVVAGLALGVGLAVVSEFARSSYRTVGDLAAVMNVPVLGAIETIVTRRERRQRQLSRAVAGLSTAMIVGSIGWVTWLWSQAPERLPIEVQDAIEHLRSALK